MDLPQRKQNRLPEYDYSSPGVYFVTICTKDMAEMFWRNTEPTALIDVPFVGEITDLPGIGCKALLFWVNFADDVGFGLQFERGIGGTG